MLPKPRFALENCGRDRVLAAVACTMSGTISAVNFTCSSRGEVHGGSHIREFRCSPPLRTKTPSAAVWAKPTWIMYRAFVCNSFHLQFACLLFVGSRRIVNECSVYIGSNIIQLEYVATYERVHSNLPTVPRLCTSGTREYL